MKFTYKDDPMFNTIVRWVINSEGEWSNDPRDPGGPTKWGCAWNKVGHIVKSMYGYSTWQEMREKLTQDQAKELYFIHFYKASGAAGLSDEGLSYMQFDCAVNQGVGRARKLLKGLPVNPFHYDGRGSKNSELFLYLYFEYMIARMEEYAKLPLSLREINMTGWMNRLRSVYAGIKVLEKL